MNSNPSSGSISILARSPGLEPETIRGVVTVPTFRRPEQLLETLASLQAQRTGRRFAVIVMENEAEAREGAAAAQPLFESGAIGGMVIVAHERGNCSAYNAGWQTALLNFPSFEHLLVIDDDEIADPRLAGAHVRASRDAAAPISSAGRRCRSFAQAAHQQMGDPSGLRTALHAERAGRRALFVGQSADRPPRAGRDGTALPRPADSTSWAAAIPISSAARRSAGFRLAWCAEAPGARNRAGAPRRSRLDPRAQPAQRRHLDPGREEEARRHSRSADCKVLQRAWRCSPLRRFAARWQAGADRLAFDRPSTRSMSRSAACWRNSDTPMSNTGSLRRTEPRPTRRGVLTRARRHGHRDAILLTVVMVSFRPFQPDGARAVAGTAATSSTSSASARSAPSALFSLLSFADRAWSSGVLQPVVAAAAGLPRAFGVQRHRPVGGDARRLLHGDRHSDDDDRARPAARRRRVFDSARRRRALRSSSLSYVGLVIFPDVAIHTADSIEPEHAGLWRGVFPHKNIAGPVMACFSFGGLYLWRRGWKRAGRAAVCRGLGFHGQHRLQDHRRAGAAGDRAGRACPA